MVGASRLNEEKVEVIKQLLEMGEHTHQQIADMFNVNRTTITNINTGRRWNPEIRSFVMKNDKIYREMLDKKDHVTINRVIIELSNGQRFEL